MRFSFMSAFPELIWVLRDSNIPIAFFHEIRFNNIFVREEFTLRSTLRGPMTARGATWYNHWIVEGTESVFVWIHNLSCSVLHGIFVLGITWLKRLPASSHTSKPCTLERLITKFIYALRGYYPLQKINQGRWRHLSTFVSFCSAVIRILCWKRSQRFSFRDCSCFSATHLTFELFVWSSGVPSLVSFFL